jgi:hypothetical protein
MRTMCVAVIIDKVAYQLADVNHIRSRVHNRALLIKQGSCCALITLILAALEAKHSTCGVV